MSNPPQKQRERVITLEELVVRAGELKDKIEALNTTLNIYLNQYQEIQLALNTLRELPEKHVDGYIVVDRLSSILVPASISETWRDNVLVNIGLNYYLKTSKEKAMEILSNRMSNVEKLINTIRTQQKTILDEYLRIQQILNQVIQAQQAKTTK